MNPVPKSHSKIDYNDNLIIIDELNASTHDSAFYAPNKFADMTPAEFKKKMLMEGKASDS